MLTHCSVRMDHQSLIRHIHYTSTKELRKRMGLIQSTLALRKSRICSEQVIALQPEERHRCLEGASGYTSPKTLERSEFLHLSFLDFLQ